MPEWLPAAGFTEAARLRAVADALARLYAALAPGQQVVADHEVPGLLPP